MTQVEFKENIKQALLELDKTEKHITKAVKNDLFKKKNHYIDILYNDYKTIISKLSYSPIATTSISMKRGKSVWEFTLTIEYARLEVSASKILNGELVEIYPHKEYYIAC